jgi:hypothetical protein
MIAGILSGFLTGECYMIVMKSFCLCVWLNLCGGKLDALSFVQKT